MNLKDRVFCALTAGGLGLVAAYPAAAANAIFLKIPGVTGPATTAGFQGDIPVLAYSQGFANPSTLGGTGTGAGKVSCGSINIQKLLDSSSTFFLGSVVTGSHIASATIYFTERAANGTETVPYTLVLTNLLVTSVAQGDSAGKSAGVGVTEDISLVAEKFQFTFGVGSSGTPQTVSWDCLTNTGTGPGG